MAVILSNLKDISIALWNIVKHLFEGWHIKKVINFSNFLKIAFIYVVSIFWVIAIDFEYSDGFWQKAITGQFSERRFSVYSVKQRIGEGLLYERMLKYADDNGYDYSGCRFPEGLTHFPLTAHFYQVGASLLNYILQPNFNLSVTHHVNIVPQVGYNIAYLNMPRDALYTAYGNFQGRWSHLNHYDAYADLYSLSNSQNELLQHIATNEDGKKPIIPIYLAQLKSEYKELEFNQTLVTGSLWGCNRGSLRTKLAIKKLADDGLIEAIGLPDFAYLGDCYKGKMEDYGNVVTAVVEQAQKYGISLIIHNEEHMLDGIPTSRISESSSSSAFIISDRNKFLEQYFSDSVLFIDIAQNEEQLYQQIKSHIMWVKEHPQEALAMTKKAFNTFNDNFTIEEQMEKLFSHHGRSNI